MKSKEKIEKRIEHLEKIKDAHHICQEQWLEAHIKQGELKWVLGDK